MKDLLKQLADKIKEEQKTVEKSLNTLKDAGILDREGNFTEPYKHLENMSKSKFERTERRGIFSEVKEYCHLSKEYDYIEVTEWSTAEGIDIDLSCNHGGKLSLTWGQFKLIKKLVKQLDNTDIDTAMGEYTGNDKSIGRRKLNEVKFNIGNTVEAGNEGENEITAVYKNAGDAIYNVIGKGNADAAEQLAFDISKDPKLAALPCYLMGNGYLYHEKDLSPF